MPEITLTNNKGRDAQVMAESVRIPVRVRWLDNRDRQVSSARIMKGTLDRDYDALLAKAGSPEKLVDELIADDPEIDLETAGSFLRETSRVFVNSSHKIVHAITQMEIVRNPDGTEKLRRPKKLSVANVSAEQPLLWSGKMLPKRDVYNKFVIINKMQIVHINGLTYDFLYGIAKELEEAKSLLVVGAGPKSNQPLILRRGSLPYRGFLEGRIRGDEYCLLLHLSNIELKAPEAKAATSQNTPEAS